ncbi:MAG: hypothetical protein WA885_07375 [Phormidesmis sp.]
MLLIDQKRYLPLLLLVALVSCKPTPQSSIADASVDASETVIETDGGAEKSAATDSVDIAKPDSGSADKNTPQPEPIASALQPGTYCYEFSDEIKDIQARLMVDAADRVVGNVVGVIHDNAQGYYTSYRSRLDGTIDGSNMNLDVATWIEYDQQNRQETWQVSLAELRTDRDRLTKASCDGVNQAFQNEDGLEAKDLTSSANRVKTEQVYFGSGKSGTTVSDSVVRGDRDVYILTAQGGQQMDLAITALENNAVFDIVDPSGLILGTELTKETVFLPHTGDYKIIVGGTRGNATYDLAIAIK